MRDLRWFVFVPFCWGVYQLLRGHPRKWSSKYWIATYIGLSSVFFLSAITKFTAYEVNGVDFSIFDWMLHNTVAGRFMWSPFCNCNHFGVHPNWLLLVLVPLHAVWQSPWLLVFFHALSLAVSIPLLRRLIQVLSLSLSDAEIFLVLAALTASQAMGSITNYGFHPETWYIPIGLWFLCNWHKDRWQWLLPGLLFAAVKEDGVLFLASWAFASVFRKEFRWQSINLIIFSMIFFFVNTKILQPMAWPSHDFKPSWTVFWEKYGHTPPEIILNILSHPFTSLSDLVASGSWHWFVPFAFLPLLSLRALLGMLPGIVMLGLASSEVLRGFGVYYAAPILPFALFGWLVGLERLSNFLPKKYFVRLFAVLTCLFGFVGGVGPRIGIQKPAVDVTLRQWTKQYQQSTNTTCLQTALYPHVDYADGFAPLLDPALCGSNAVVDSRLDPYPFGNTAELLQKIQQRGWHDLATRVPR